MREALRDDARTPDGAAPSTPPDLDGLDRIRPGQKYLVVGDSAHPRRILLSALPELDLRRIAAERVPEPDTGKNADPVVAA